MDRKVIDYKIDKNTTIAALIDKFGHSGGFTASKLYIAHKIIKKMIEDEGCTRFISFPACIVATGLRGLLAEAIRKKMFHVIITTCGALDHDFARAWRPYYHGDFMANDIALKKKGVHRLGNIFIPQQNYGQILEEKMQQIFNEVIDDQITVSELIRRVALKVNDEGSIFYQAAKHDIPVFVPGIMDGAFGSQLWLYSQKKKFSLDLFGDQNTLASIVFSAKRSGALLVGGGISKHHTIWWHQFRDGLDYAVYITTAQEYDGSLSGARLREAISWSKVSVNARYVTVEGDATVLLPLILGPLM